MGAGVKAIVSAIGALGVSAVLAALGFVVRWNAAARFGVPDVLTIDSGSLLAEGAIFLLDTSHAVAATVLSDAWWVLLPGGVLSALWSLRRARRRVGVGGDHSSGAVGLSAPNAPGGDRTRSGSLALLALVVVALAKIVFVDGAAFDIRNSLTRVRLDDARAQRSPAVLEPLRRALVRGVICRTVQERYERKDLVKTCGPSDAFLGAEGSDRAARTVRRLFVYVLAVPALLLISVAANLARNSPDLGSGVSASSAVFCLVVVTLSLSLAACYGRLLRSDHAEKVALAVTGGGGLIGATSDRRSGGNHTANETVVSGYLLSADANRLVVLLSGRPRVPMIIDRKDSGVLVVEDEGRSVEAATMSWYLQEVANDKAASEGSE